MHADHATETIGDQETCEIVSRPAGPFRWRLVATTRDRVSLRESDAFVSTLIVPSQNPSSQRALDRLITSLVASGWHVVRRNDDAPRRSREDWWRTYLVR